MSAVIALIIIIPAIFHAVFLSRERAQTRKSDQSFRQVTNELNQEKNEPQNQYREKEVIFVPKRDEKKEGRWERMFYSGTSVSAGQEITLFSEADLGSMILTRYRRYAPFEMRSVGMEGDFMRVLFRKWQWFNPEEVTFDLAYVHLSECQPVQVSESIYFETPGRFLTVASEDAPEGLPANDWRIFSGLYYAIPQPGEEAWYQFGQPAPDAYTEPVMGMEADMITEPRILYIPPNIIVETAGVNLVLGIHAAASDEALIRCNENLPDGFAHMQLQDPRAGFIVGMIDGR